MENRLRWFGLVRRRDDLETVRTVMGMHVEGRRGRGRRDRTRYEYCCWCMRGG